MDDDYPANPVGRITVHTLSQFCTGDIHVKSPGVKRGSDILYPFDRFLNILNDFIVTHNEDNLPRAKIDRIHTVPDSIDIDQFSIKSESIGAAEKKVRSHL